jgi:hypothetical protein
MPKEDNEGESEEGGDPCSYQHERWKRRIPERKTAQICAVRKDTHEGAPAEGGRKRRRGRITRRRMVTAYLSLKATNLLKSTAF